MPQPAYRDSRIYGNNIVRNESAYASVQSTYSSSPNNLYYISNDQLRRHDIKPNQKKIKRNNIIHKVITLLFLLFAAFIVSPSMMNKYIKSISAGHPYNNLRVNINELVHPLEMYFPNALALNVPTIEKVETKKPLMQPPKETTQLSVLKNKLINLQNEYPSIHSSVYVWDYDGGNYVDINADEIFSAASIIKLPVLIALFKNIEAGQTSIFDEMTLTSFYRAEGSGSLQYKMENSKYSIDTLANVMITNSDNSATNMLMTQIGGMNDINRQIRTWGLGKTRINNWLPDLEGTNYITARDMGRLLYNINNPKFLSTSSREKIVSYMSHVKNDRLIPAGLGTGADFMHKTGDIGKMLGDAGIVYAPNGKKYIVVILANRPYNSVKGKEFIVEASRIIYNYLVK